MPLAEGSTSPGAPRGAPSAISIISLTARVVCEKRSAMNQHNDRSDDPKPVIEPGRDGAEHVELMTRALRLRIRQQEILAELGVLALQGTPFLQLLNRRQRDLRDCSSTRHHTGWVVSTCEVALPPHFHGPDF